MNLRQKLFILISFLLLAFGAMITFYAKDVSIKINEKWGTRFVSQQLIFDKTKTLLPIMQELELVKKLAKEQTIIDMALDENNQKTYDNGIKTLEKYRTKFHSKSYFSAFSKTNHYYYNDINNKYKNKELIYTLNEQTKSDKWFFKTLKQKKIFNINIDKDLKTNVTNIWINCQIIADGKVIGVVGTGFNLKSFLKNFVDTAQDEVYNIFVDENLAIQLERNKNLIDYATISKSKKDKTTIAILLKDKNEIKKLKKVIASLKKSNDDKITTLWLNFDSHTYLVAISYIKELGWFNITAIDSLTLTTINSKDITPIFVISLILLLIIMWIFVNFQIILPLNKLKEQMEEIAENGYNTNKVLVKGDDEIAKLSQQFQKLLKIVSTHEQHLENMVKERTDELYEKQQFLNSILDNVDAYIFIKDTNLHYTYVNKAMQEAMQEPLENIIGKDINNLYDEETIKNINKSDKQTILLGERIVSEEKIVKEGLDEVHILVKKVPLYDTDGNIYALLGVSTDITERKRYEAMIEEMAYFDPLTKLPNRRMLEDRLEKMLAKSKRDRTHGGVMFLDMDNFKSINDTYGHDVGDILLIEASKRYLSAVRESDTVARLGGDEFIIAINELNSDKDLAKKEIFDIANKILKLSNEKYTIKLIQDNKKKKNIELISTLSIGITLFNHNDTLVEGILQRADKAMYKVKHSDKNGIYMFE